MGRPPAVARLADWPEGRHERVADAQQTLNYLDRLLASLQSLKGTLSAQLARPTQAVVDKRASREAERLSALLRERAPATAGRLDPQLRFNGAVEVRQAFKIKGLDLQALRSGEREVLHFAAHGSHDVVSVVIDPAMSDAAMVRRLTQALAPLNIRVERDAQGELQLSVPREQWAAVRDSLSIRGGGQRFPAGQLNRVKLEAVPPEALRPDTWDIESPQGTRKALLEVMGALERATKSREQAQAVVDAGRGDAASESAQQVWAEAAALAFRDRMLHGGFEAFAQIAPAAMGMTRSQVEALLAA